MPMGTTVPVRRKILEPKPLASVILQPNVWVVEVGQAIERVEADQKRAVSDEKVTRHSLTLL